MIITIISPDKLTLSMFSDFYKTLYNSDVKEVDLTCLFSSDIIDGKIKEILQTSLKGRTVLIKYKIKNQTKEFHPSVIEHSSMVVKFDIFSTEPEIIKSTGEETSNILDRWKNNIQALNSKKMF